MLKVVSGVAAIATLFGGWLIAVVLLPQTTTVIEPGLYCREDGRCLDVGAYVTEMPSGTPPITATPEYTVQPSNPPTERPTASRTPSITVTPVVETPNPDATPLPPVPLQGCIGRVFNVLGLSLREDHEIGASRLGVLRWGESVEIQGFYVYKDAIDEWAYIQTAQSVQGWVAAYYYEGARMLLWPEDGTECYPPGVWVEYAGRPASPLSPATEAQTLGG